ncbi:MAG TPA: thiamine pyrophosphate-requiring protein [Rhodopila sp.]|uniref:thiamine pyrophosphate-requiring protein n=1 Tax=Rhodopila sp. TaxID=2480087 RepID=UPI002B8D8851|nr:thiamine pyrophosphate-requiring protein [Rhodopila sp.]HVY15271.1 thiamine pyrophosphate-requiring protein [Rhodopila sp.]
MSRIAAEYYLEALAEHGIEYLFANPGTDFAPIVEAYARINRTNTRLPRPLVVPHENAAVAMAHGYTVSTGRPQAVMLHTNVGTANAINMLINASRDRVPMLLTSGRTPFTETGAEGSRSVHIHWSQEMFDQAGMLREVVKWDYEMKRGDQAATTVDRAMEIAMMSPQGPVYLSLPREVLGERLSTPAESALGHRARPKPPVAPAEDVETLANWIAAAKQPLIITGHLGRDPRDAVVLARLAERYALPVVPYQTRYFAIGGDHPMFFGGAPGPLLQHADLVIVFDTDVPWLPSKQSPPAGARVVQIGEDPLFARLPMRSFPSDLTIRATCLSVLEGLEKALEGRAMPHLAGRRAALAEESRALHAKWATEAEAAGKTETITLPWLNRCLRDVIDSDTKMVSEYSFLQEYCPLPGPGSLYAVSLAGGLGWGLGASLGIKLAHPDSLVVSVLGDGAYMFANPTACHATAQAQNLPTLTVIYNNALYNAVRRATLDMYAHGAAAEADGRFMAELPTPAFEKLMAAHDGYGERVDRPADLPAALERATVAVRAGRQAVVNVICR